MTDVSTRPRGCCRSGTRRDVLVDHRIYVGPESVRVNRGSARERCERDAGGDELSGPHWRQLSHRHAIAGDQKRLAPIQPAHDLATGVPELALRDRTGHIMIVAPVLRGPFCVSAPRLAADGHNERQSRDQLGHKSAIRLAEL